MTALAVAAEKDYFWHNITALGIAIKLMDELIALEEYVLKVSKTNTV